MPPTPHVQYDPSTGIAAALAATVEDELTSRFPDLHPRCRGYVRRRSIPISITVERQGVLRLFQLVVSNEETRGKTLLQLHRALCEQAAVAIDVLQAGG
jgi:hypothetical protein